MFKRIIFAVLILAAISVNFSCSANDPVTNEIKVLPENPEDSMPLFIADSDDGLPIGRGMLGAFNLKVTMDPLGAELTPMRNMAKEGDSFLTNLMPYFTTVPCVDCLSVAGVAIDAQSQLVITFRVKHPFPQADTTLPPSGKNRDDLRIFDTKLIVAAEGAKEFPRTKITLNPMVIANADGYTTIEDILIDKTNDVDANANPYIILAEDRTEGNVDPTAITGFTDLALASGHNVINQGQTYYSDLVIYQPFGGVIDLNLYMFGAYGQSSLDLSDRLTPQYWLPEFNIKEPWKVEVHVIDNSLNNAQAESSADLEIKVWDWQHSNLKVDQYLTELDSIKAQSKISSVAVDVPGVNMPIDVVTEPTSGNGLQNTPLVYSVKVNNDRLAKAGSYYGLVKVLDNRASGLNYGSLGELVDVSLTTGLEFIKITEFATYQVFQLDIAEAGGAPCGPISASYQYGEPGSLIMYPVRDNELNFITGSEWNIKVLPTVPNGSVTNINFDFDHSSFQDQTGTSLSIQRVYTNSSCPGTNPLTIHLTVTITDNCAASADFVDTLTINIYCGQACGPMTVGTFTYALNGGDYEPFPTSGITVNNNDELSVKANGFSVTNGQITKYTFDFDNPEIEDQSRTSNTITRVISLSNCPPGGAPPIPITLDVTVEDNCAFTRDYEKDLGITVNCTSPCGPIQAGLFEYSQNSSPFVAVATNMLTVMDNTELAFRLNGYTSAGANITGYTFIFSDPSYPSQSGTEDTVTKTFVNPNCSTDGRPHFVTMKWSIADDCPESSDLNGQVTIKILCSSCNGAGLSISQSARVLASGTTMRNPDITKSGGKGMKLADGGGGFIFAGYLATRISDNKPGIGVGRSGDNGGSWPIAQFIPTTVLPGGFSLTTGDAITIIVAWFNPDEDKIFINRSVNGGIAFDSTEIYDSSNDISSISLTQDPRDPSRVYLSFIEIEDAISGTNQIVTFRSIDTGATFPSASKRIVARSRHVYGRPFTAADIMVSEMNGDVYVCAAQNDSIGSNIFVIRSNNFGDSFDAGGKVLSSVNGSYIDTIDIASTLVDPNGQGIYIAFSQGTSLKGNVKLARGNVNTESFVMINEAISDTTSKRCLEVACATDKVGNVYVAWQDDRASAGKYDVYADYSRDLGVTFGEDKIVNESAAGSAVRTSPEIVNSQSDCEMIFIYEDNSTVENGEVYTRVG